MLRGAVALIAALGAGTALAHPGGVDRHGCHMNHEVGEYHCHREDAARLHTGESKGQVTIVDGDTLKMHNLTIKLHGIDTLERDQVCRRSNGEEWPCGKQALAALTEYIGRQTVSCVHHGRDVLGRTIATCFTPKGSINEWLVLQGWAVAYRRHSYIYSEVELEARRARRNIWSGTFTTPEEHRRDK
jgi:endonuclease YncB( thermonuclease family)